MSQVENCVFRLVLAVDPILSNLSLSVDKLFSIGKIEDYCNQCQDSDISKDMALYNESLHSALAM